MKGFFGATLIALFLVIHATKEEACTANAGVYHFKWGEWSVTVIQDGTFTGIDAFFLIPSFVLRRYFDFINPGSEPEFSLNTLLLRRQNDVLLVDTGTGPGPAQPGEPPTGLHLGRLCSVGVQHEQVTGVLITHAHGDHTGGLVNADGNAIFPNARVYIGRIEAEFWRLPVDTIIERAPQLPVALVVNETRTAYAAVVKAYPGKIQKLNHLESPFGGVQAWLTPGHTPGHMAYRISSGEKSFVVVGDALVNRAVTVQNPEWNIISDANRTQAVRTSFDLLDKLADNKILAVLYHEIFPGIGYIIRDRATFDFSAVARIS